MQVRVKVTGMLKSKTPASGSLQLPQDATIRDALLAMDIPPDSVQVFTVNGKLERDPYRMLAENDQLSIIPPVGGG